VSRPPEFDDLVEGIESEEERDRLRRVHELLVSAGPPPDLSPALALSPEAPASAEADEDGDFEWLPPRRLWTGLLAGAAALAAAFGVGYLAGDRSTESRAAARPAPAEPAGRVISLRPSDQNDTSGATIELGTRAANGNWPMTVTVRGLKHLTSGDYYALALTKNGKPVVTCGTFNVSAQGATTIRMTAAYDLDAFEGWAITRYKASTHREWVLMRQTV